VFWIRCLKNCWPRVLGPVVIKLYLGECTPSIDRVLNARRRQTMVATWLDNGHTGSDQIIYFPRKLCCFAN